MLAYEYLISLYRAILSQSTAIKGRVFMAPFYASELNSPNLEQIVADSLSGLLKKEYPLSLLLPPVSVADFTDDSPTTWEPYTINQLFLKQEGRSNAGQMENLNRFTNNSQHTITQDWNDMRRVAKNFLRQLRILPIDHNLHQVFRISSKVPQRIVPVTRMGNDKLNGVMLTYQVSLFESCTLEDYATADFSTVTFPTTDQHPEHAL